MKSLDVRYNGRLVGKLFQDESGKMLFQYDDDWISNGFAISMSLPFRHDVFFESECRPFFEGLLPEGNIRTEIARNLKVSARNEFAILEGIGGDCAGAISIGPSKVGSEKYETQIEGKYDPEDVFKRHWHRFAEEISVSASFVDNQIKDVVKLVEMQSKMIADNYFNRFQRPKVITDILEIIFKRLQRLRNQ